MFSFYGDPLAADERGEETPFTFSVALVSCMQSRAVVGRTERRRKTAGTLSPPAGLLRPVERWLVEWMHGHAERRRVELHKGRAIRALGISQQPHKHNDCLSVSICDAINHSLLSAEVCVCIYICRGDDFSLWVCKTQTMKNWANLVIGVNKSTIYESRRLTGLHSSLPNNY